MRAVILTLSIVGTLLFGAAFAMSFVSPLTIERVAREWMRVEVEKRVGTHIDAISDSRIADFARKALAKTNADVDKLERDLREGVPRRVANAMADFMNADCECRKRLVERHDREARQKLGTLGQLRERLGEVIESTYTTVRDRMLREWRIFTGVNTAAFALLGALAMRRAAGTPQLMVPAVVLLAAGVLTAALYLFNQDWLGSMVFGNTVGWAYVAYFGLAAAFFADIVANRARITAKLLSSLGVGGGGC